MIRLTFLFRPGAADEGASVFQPWLPLIEALPALMRVEIAEVLEKPFGDVSAAALVDTYFEHEHAMHEAMASPAGKKLARELMGNPRTAPEMLLLRVLDRDAIT